MSYTGRTEAVSHDEVECSTGLAPVAVHTAAAVLKHFLAQICTLLSLLLEQHVPKLQPVRPPWTIISTTPLNTNL